jgi:dTDP-4-amino-4,6-dideoxygalactose transaminase
MLASALLSRAGRAVFPAGVRDALTIAAMRTPVPFAPPDLGAAELDEVQRTLESGWLSTGPRVHRFEEAFAAYVGARHAVAVNSCTAALHLSLIAADVGAGDEVITSPLTFCATANTIVHAGARPVFADIDPCSWNLGADAAAAAITSRTRAIVPVHYAGRPADMMAFEALARPRGLTLIEDAAHAIEAVDAGRKIGTIGQFTCFSFYATKNLTTGEGGMVTTADADAAARIRIASLHGIDRDAWSRYAPGGRSSYQVQMAGFKYNMMDLQAAIGLHQLARIGEMHARRRAISARYDAGLAGLPLQRPAPAAPGMVHAHHLYPVLVDPRVAGVDRDELQRRLRSRGITTSIHFPVLHLQPFYAERYGFCRGMFPVAERVADQTLSLPLSSALSDGQIDCVLEALHASMR